ncbi:MAG TPA: hypothetical protein VIF09_25075, partial [Polyangiaceae bacterium]
MRPLLALAAVCLAGLAPAACGLDLPPSSQPDPGAPTGATPGTSSASDAGSPSPATEGGLPPPPAAGDDGGGTEAGPPPSCPPSWTATPACGGGGASSGAPDFGPNVLVFDPSMSTATIQQKLDAIYAQQDAAQFDSGRYAYFFKPGQYALDVKIGFYVQAVGLGRSPDDVAITGAVRAKADWLGSNNATCNFWRGAENLAVTADASIDNGVDRWAVSQGTHLRRIHVRGDIALDDGGWSSGGFVADSLVDGTMSSGTQQQFLTRNDDLTWQGSNWNMVFVGDGQPPA